MGTIFYQPSKYKNMRTPAGFECPYFYGNYFRGKKQEECRLIGQPQPVGDWSADLCKSCPVPGIVRANACPNMILHGKVEYYFLGLKRRVKITAVCKNTNQNIAEPEIGCGHCHELPDFQVDKN
jgi:hypothetical protein